MAITKLKIKGKEMLLVNILQKKPDGILSKTIKIYDVYPDLDFYENVALRLGWKQDNDALIFLSSKGIIKVEKLTEENDYKQQDFAFAKPILDCLKKINN